MVKLLKYDVPTGIFVLQDSVRPSTTLTASISDLYVIDNAFHNIAHHSRGVVENVDQKSKLLALYPLPRKGRKGKKKFVWTSVMYPASVIMVCFLAFIVVFVPFLVFVVLLHACFVCMSKKHSLQRMT